LMLLSINDQPTAFREKLTHLERIHHYLFQQRESLNKILIFL
jgi:hypothetical protein